MKRIVSLLAVALIGTSGCLQPHEVRPAPQPVKTPAAPSRPPVTEGQVSEANASAAAQALSEELNREDSAANPAAAQNGQAAKR
jgi:hypothetical protein